MGRHQAAPPVPVGVNTGISPSLRNWLAFHPEGFAAELVLFRFQLWRSHIVAPASNCRCGANCLTRNPRQIQCPSRKVCGDLVGDHMLYKKA
jgi:hypothetical protein